MPTVAPNQHNALGVTHLLPLRIYEDQALEYDGTWGIHNIFVPSDLGGRLHVGFGKKDAPDPERRLFLHGSNGVDVELQPDKGEAIIDFEPGTRGDGKCCATVIAPAGKYSIYARFVEEGFARDGDEPLIPWNFWFYPYAAHRRHQSVWGSDVVHPLEKYEKAFDATGVAQWEREHHDDPDESRNAWEGHCHNAAPASVMFAPPPDEGVRHNGVHFSCEELKVLATEHFGNFGVTEMVWRLPRSNVETRDGPFEVIKPMEAPAEFGAKKALIALIATLRKHIRDAGRALVMDLRDATGDDPTAVWNHAVYRYVTFYAQEDDDLHVVHGRTTLYANQDAYSDDGTSTGMPARAKVVDGVVRPVPTSTDKRITLAFQVRFRWTGGITEYSTDNRWNSVKTVPESGQAEFIHAPRWAMRVVAPLPFRKPGADGNARVDGEHVLELARVRKDYR